MQQKAIFQIIDYKFDKVFIDNKNNKDEKINLEFNPKGIYNESMQVFELNFIVKITKSKKNL